LISKTSLRGQLAVRYPDPGLLGIPFPADPLEGFPETLHLYQPVLLALENGVHAGAQKLAGFVAEQTRILQFDVRVTGTNQTGLTAFNLQTGGGGSVTSGQVYDVWGAQMEVAPSADQYVATLDAPVTVTADSTNILPSSTQVSGQGWYVYNGTVAANASSVTAPDGTNTADVFTATSGSTAGYIYDTVAHPSLYDGATVTGSIYLRAANTPQSLLINIGSVNASGGTIISTLPASVTTAWQRFDLPPGTAVNGMTLLYLSLGAESNSQFVSTNPIYIWGTQMEMGSSPGAVDETNNYTTGTGGTVLATNGLNQTYSYDGFGNMLSAGNFNFMQSYTTSNQLSGWNYDASGNLLIDGFNTGYAYDAEGRVSGEGQWVIGNPSTFSPATSYVYDADGSRVAKSGSSAVDYIEFGGRQLARLSGGQWTDLIYGVSGLLAEVPGTQAGTPVYRMVDHLGSVAGTLNSSGTLLSSLDYAPFGQIFAGGTADPYVFTGKERDTESGNDYFGARYYGSSMGRFTSPDPVLITTERLMNPQQLNLYAYVANNPLRFIDPTGEILQCVGDAKSQSQCFSDLQQIAGDAKDRLSMDAKTGVVSFDTKDLDLSKNEGASLVNDLVGSKNTYDFSVGPTIMTDKGPVRVDHIGTDMANLPTFGDQRQIGNPPAGVSDILDIYFNNPNMTRVSNTNLGVAPEWTVVFHELAEAYEKIDGGKGGSYAAGHNAAVQRETTLRDQRPYLKQYNTGAGGPANSPNPQGGIIIKK